MRALRSDSVDVRTAAWPASNGTGAPEKAHLVVRLGARRQLLERIVLQNLRVQYDVAQLVSRALFLKAAS